MDHRRFRNEEEYSPQIHTDSHRSIRQMTLVRIIESPAAYFGGSRRDQDRRILMHFTSPG